ncbi:hypothetical protein BDC45DRAFT_518272 [Circinella umbellata]|nr:hypothetical protein BDC45DRAFT_518272 [Circinella umbellata]
MLSSIIEYLFQFFDILAVLVANAAAFFQAVYEIAMNDGQQQQQHHHHRRRQVTPNTTPRHRHRLPQQQEEQQLEEKNPYSYHSYRRHGSPQQTQRRNDKVGMRKQRFLAQNPNQQQQQMLLKQYKQQRTNYINNLPNEILTVVFEMTSSPQHLYQCTLVNHRWHALVTPILWRAPVLTGPVCCFPLFMKSSNTPPCDYMYCQSTPKTSSSVPSDNNADNNNTFPIHLAKYGSAIRTLILPPQHTTDCSMAHIARSCPNLQDLTLDGCKRVSNLGLLFLTRHVSKLERLSVNRCILIDDQGISYLNTQHKLSVLSIAGLKQVSSPGLTRLIQQLPYLHALDISDCSGLSTRTATNSSNNNNDLQELIRACGNKMTYMQLNRITALNNNNNNSMTMMILDCIIESCPNIQHLGVARKQKRSSDRQLNDLIDSLERHHIGLTRLGANLVRRHRQRQRQRQKHVDAHVIDQQNFLHLIGGLKHLQYLDVSNWNSLEGDWIKEAVASHKITNVQLSGCHYVTTSTTNKNNNDNNATIAIA